MFAEATKKAAGARFKKRQVDSEGQEIEVRHACLFRIVHIVASRRCWPRPLDRCLQYDVREDEEQNVKLTECIDLLLAAGYFRARIKGLTPFDKVCKCLVYVSDATQHTLWYNLFCVYLSTSDCRWYDLVSANLQLWCRCGPSLSRELYHWSKNVNHFPATCNIIFIILYPLAN